VPVIAEQGLGHPSFGQWFYMSNTKPALIEMVVSPQKGRW